MKKTISVLGCVDFDCFDDEISLGALCVALWKLNCCYLRFEHELVKLCLELGERDV